MPSGPFRAIIGALLAALALLLGGCSTAKLGYNNAPALTYWWLDSYLDFTAAQSPRVRTNLDQLHAWHRDTELPAYANLLTQWQGAVPGNISGEQVCAWTDSVRPRVAALLEQAVPTLAALAPSLSPAQLTHLTRQFDKRNQKWREEWLDGTPAERQARRLKQLTERAETLYGPLEDTQRAALRAGLAESLFDASQSYQDNLRRQQDMLQTLRAVQSADVSDQRRTAELRALLTRTQTSPDAAYLAHRTQVVRVNCQAFADLHNSTTPTQRARAATVLKNYGQDVRALMGSRNTP